MLKKIGLSLTGLSILIILLGITKRLLYYLNFDVPIKDFLDMSELGLIVSGDLLILLPILFIFIFSSHYFLDSVIKTTEISAKVMYIPLIVIIGSCIYLFFKICIAFYSGIYTKILWGIGVSLIIIVVLSFVFRIVHQYLPKPKDRIPIILFMLLNGLILVFTSKHIFRVEHGLYKGTVVQTEDSTYISSDSIF